MASVKENEVMATIFQGQRLVSSLWSAQHRMVYGLTAGQIHSFRLELGHCASVFKTVDIAFQAILLIISAVKPIKL